MSYTRHFNPGKESLNILQLSDLHLTKAGGLHSGVNTNQRLLKLIEHIKTKPEIQYDLLFLTGDLSQDKTEESYIECVTSACQLACPIFWIPGNHDAPQKAKRIFSKYKQFSLVKKLQTKYWDFIFVDSCLKDKSQGFISEDEMLSVEHHIKDTTDQKNIALVMHHHPLPVGIAKIDQAMLQNYKYFFEALKLYPAVKLIICGHVHGNYSLSYETIRIETSPATCFQWTEMRQPFDAENYSGYIIYEFQKNCYEKTVFKFYHD